MNSVSQVMPVQRLRRRLATLRAHIGRVDAVITDLPYEMSEAHARDLATALAEELAEVLRSHFPVDSKVRIRLECFQRRPP